MAFDWCAIYRYFSPTTSYKWELKCMNFLIFWLNSFRRQDTDVVSKGVPLQNPEKSENLRKTIFGDKILRGNISIRFLHSKSYRLMYRTAMAQKYTSKTPIPWTILNCISLRFSTIWTKPWAQISHLLREVRNLGSK